MTVVETYRSPRAASSAGRRLLRLHLVSRQAPTALAALLGCALVLRLALQAHLVPLHEASGRQVPVLVEGMAAAIVVLTARNPFGEAERTAGGRLPWLRLGTALLMTGAAVALLMAACAGARLPGGTLDVLRDVAGMTGIGLLCAPVIGGGVAWLGPLTYVAAAEFTLTQDWHSPWMWTGRPPHDLGAALCAGLAFVAGTAFMTLRGSRDRADE